VVRGEATGKFTAREPTSDDWAVLELLVATPRARARGLTLEALRALHPVERLAWRWVLFNETALQDIEGVEGCTVVRYEDVCADPETRARGLLAFAGLPWHPQTRAFVAESTSRNSDAYYALFKDPVRAATSWREQLSRDDVDRIVGVLRQSRLAELYSPAEDPERLERTSTSHE
jgi:hypothetical protein